METAQACEGKEEAASHASSELASEDDDVVARLARRQWRGVVGSGRVWGLAPDSLDGLLDVCLRCRAAAHRQFLHAEICLHHRRQKTERLKPVDRPISQADG